MPANIKMNAAYVSNTSARATVAYAVALALVFKSNGYAI